MKYLAFMGLMYVPDVNGRINRDCTSKIELYATWLYILDRYICRCVSVFIVFSYIFSYNYVT